MIPPDHYQRSSRRPPNRRLNADTCGVLRIQLDAILRGRRRSLVAVTKNDSRRHSEFTLKVAFITCTGAPASINEEWTLPVHGGAVPVNCPRAEVPVGFCESVGCFVMPDLFFELIYGANFRAEPHPRNIREKCNEFFWFVARGSAWQRDARK